MRDPLLEALVGDGPHDGAPGLDRMLAAVTAQRRRRHGLGLAATVVLPVAAWLLATRPAPPATELAQRPNPSPTAAPAPSLTPHEVLRTRAGGVDVIRSGSDGLARVTTAGDASVLERLHGEHALLAALPGPAGLVGEGIHRRLVLFAGAPAERVP